MGKRSSSVKSRTRSDIDEDDEVELLSTSSDPCLPLMFRFKGTVAAKIWWKLVLMVIYTVAIVGLHNFVPGLQMNFPLTLVPILGVATGLVLAFRTNTAYSRYWEGRKLWSKMTLQLRSLTLCIWAGVAGSENEDESCFSSDQEDEEKKRVRALEKEKFLEKITAINLLVAFAFATKNYLRGEYSYDEEEMKELINHLPKFQTPSSNQPFSAQCPYRKRRRSKKGGGGRSRKNSGKSTADSTISLNMGGSTMNHNSKVDGKGNGSDVMINIEEETEDETEKEEERWTGSSFKLRGDRSKNCYAIKAHDFIVPSNIPLEIIYYLFTYLKHVGKQGGCDVIVMRYMYGSLLALIECLTGFERLLRTPIPLAYSIHLTYCIWLYLLSLPYQLVGTLNWLTVPAVGLASFALLGILRIGWEIENPFGYQENDLPLEDFCIVIRREIQVIIGHKLPTLGSWTMSKENHPMAPNSWLHAQDLSTKSFGELREILAKGTDGTEDMENMTFPSTIPTVPTSIKRNR